MAEYLADLGYRVTALTGMPHYPHGRVRRGYRRRMWAEEWRRGVRVLRCAHYIPRRQSAVTRALYETTFLVSAGSRIPYVDRPHVIVAVVPTLGSAIIARVLARLFHTPYAIVFQDLVGRSARQSGIAGGQRVAGMTSVVEGWAARQAKVVAAVSETFFPELTRLGVAPESLMHMPNWSQISEPSCDRDTIRSRLGWDEDEVVVLHAGNIGLKQGLEQVVDVARLAQAAGDKFRFVFVGDGNQRRAIEQRAAGLPNVTFRGFESSRSYPDVLAAADILLVSERGTATDMSLPSKLTSYFSVGRPVVAAVASAGATALEIRRSGGGIVVEAGELPAMLEAIRRLARDPDEQRRLGMAGRRYASAHLSASAGVARADALVQQLLAEEPEPREG